MSSRSKQPSSALGWSHFCRKLALLAALLIPGSASATLVTGDDPTFGVGSITTDTDTDLQWLDVTSTIFISYDTIITQFDPGDLFEGWRHATSAEVATLFTHGGVSPLNQTFAGVNSAMYALQTQIGYILNNQPAHTTFAHIADAVISSGSRSVGALWQIDPANSLGGAASWTAYDGINSTPFFMHPTTQATATGHFLVRAVAVPEPSSVLICSLPVGVAAMAARKRRRR